LRKQLKIFFSLVFIINQINFSFAEERPTLALSVITCGTSNVLYASFGHTALRYQNKAHGIDEVYNFGTFDPDTPNFYLKFLSGKLEYSLSITDYESFVEEYVSENRTIWEQKLNLSTEFIKIIYDTLQILHQPENTNYRYDFFKKNCTTKVRDLVFHQVSDTIVLNSFKEMSGETLRQSLASYLEGRSWLLIGINLLVGPYSDLEITRYDRMFLPDQLKQGLQQSGVSGQPFIIFQSGYNPSSEIFLGTPMVVFWLLLILAITEALWFRTPKKFTDSVDQLFFGLTAFLGIIFLSLWVCSEHILLRFNLNILWANPLNLLVVWSIGQNWKKFTRIYLFLYALLLFFLLINWTRLPQKFPLEIMPLVVLMAFRATNQVFHFRIEKNVNNL